MIDSTDPRPILIVDLAKRFGGAEVRVLELARGLNGRRPYAVAVLAGSPLHERLRAAGLQALPVPYGRGDPRIVSHFVRAIRRQGFGVVDAHNVQSQLWAHVAASLGGVPRRVSTVHSAYGLEHAGSARGRLYDVVLRLNQHLGVQFVVVSEAVHTHLLKLGVPERSIALVHNQVAVLPEAGTRSEVRTSLGLEPEDFVVAVVARLEPVKGHVHLLEAVRRVAVDRPMLRLLIVGDGRLRTELERQVKATRLSDRVTFTGFRDDVARLLEASDAFCLPSLSEGLPFALLEAVAHRLPLLVSRVGGMAVALEDTCARFVPPEDPEALARELQWLLDHPAEAQAMALRALEALRPYFGQEEMIAKTLAAYGA
jgi:glycosyltransferase involved in cell wall biosynthesis